MFLTSLIFLSLLVILDRYVESNRGYTQPLCGNRKKRKNSTYGDLEEEGDERANIIQITNLQKVYSGDVFAVRGVSLTIKEGEIVSLLGENGAGKSTLINILIGALSMTKG